MDRARPRLVVRAERMQTIDGSTRGTAGLEFGAQGAGIRIERRRIEVSDGIKRPTLSDLVVDPLALVVDCGSAVRRGAVRRGAVQAGDNRGADHAQASGAPARQALIKSFASKIVSNPTSRFAAYRAPEHMSRNEREEWSEPQRPVLVVKVPLRY